MNHEEIVSLAERYGSPFYIFDREEFINNLKAFISAFSRHYPDVVLGYSYKTNYIPYVCELAHDCGAYAEVVSRLELDLALRIGCPPSGIIFNGPMKTREDVDLALSDGMILHLDTLQELDYVIDFAARHPGRPLSVGLRLNIPLIDSHGRSHLYGEQAAGRFGLSPHHLEIVTRKLREHPAIRITSLHGHVSSTSRSLWVYKEIVRALAGAAATYFPDTVDTLDIGGGFFGKRVPAMGLVDTPTYLDYAEAIGDELNRNPWITQHRPRLIIEPGLAVVADAMSFVTRIFDIKEIGTRRLAVVDGTYFNVKPTLHRRNHPFEYISRVMPSGPLQKVSVVGATCMEKDCLLQDVDMPAPRRGDFIRIGNTGAYTLVLTPPFIQPGPAVLTRESGGWRAIRRRQQFEDFFNTYAFRGATEA